MPTSTASHSRTLLLTFFYRQMRAHSSTARHLFIRPFRRSPRWRGESHITPKDERGALENYLIAKPPWKTGAAAFSGSTPRPRNSRHSVEQTSAVDIRTRGLNGRTSRYTSQVLGHWTMRVLLNARLFRDPGSRH